MNKIITVIIPVFNEAENLPLLYEELYPIIQELATYNFTILFINDGSRDESLNVINQIRNHDHRVHYISLSRNFGKEVAIAAGLDHLGVHTTAAIIMDADLQHPPSLIKEMIMYWEMGYDDVYAVRENRDEERFWKKKLTSLFYKIINLTSKTPVIADAGDYRLLSRKAFTSIQKIREKERFTKGIYSWVGFNKKAIKFQVQPRERGNSKWGFFKLMGLAIDGITSFTVAPLRIATFIGIISSMLSFIWLIKVVLKTLFLGEAITGYPSLISVVLFIGGIQLISIGIIGEYIAKIFNESKNRPLYLIDELEIDDQNP